MQFVFRKKIAKLGFAKLRKAQCAERARFLHLQTTSPKSRSISNVYSLAAFTASLWPFCPFLACFWLPLPKIWLRSQIKGQKDHFLFAKEGVRWTQEPRANSMQFAIRAGSTCFELGRRKRKRVHYTANLKTLKHENNQNHLNLVFGTDCLYVGHCKYIFAIKILLAN